MGRIRSLIAAPIAALFLALGGGCKGTTSWQSLEGVPTAPLSSQVKPEANSIIQAGGTSPFATLPSSLNWITGKPGEKASKSAPTEIAVAWRNHVDYLPDPTRQGAMGPGLVGQMFLFDARDYPALADGTLTVDLYDETPRPGGKPGLKPERWQFKKDALKTLRAVDERFGPNYVLFLPWPSYRPDVTRVRITLRFDPDQKGAYTLYAPESKLALDPSLAAKQEIGAGQLQAPIPVSGDVTPAGGMAAPANGGGSGVGVSTNNGITGPGFGPIRLTRPVGQPSAASTPPVDPGPAGPVAPLSR